MIEVRREVEEGWVDLRRMKDSCQIEIEEVLAVLIMCLWAMKIVESVKDMIRKLISSKTFLVLMSIDGVSI